MASLLRPALVAAVALSAAAAPARAQEAADWVEGYFALSVEGIPDRPTIVGLVEGDRVLLPLRPVLLLTEVPMHRDGALRVLEWPPEVWRTEMDPHALTIRSGEGVTTAAPDEWLEQDGDVLLSPALLGRALGGTVRVDMPTLTVQITGAPVFPAIARLETELRRRVAEAQAQFQDPHRYDGVPYPSRTGGVAAGWSVSMTEAAGSIAGTARPTLGAGVLGGSLDLGFTGFFREGEQARTDDVLARYHRAFPGSSRVRQIEVGTIQGGGVISRPIIGASISNEPWVTPRFFDQAVVTPAVPAGWEYEVYQGNRLVGVSSTDAPAEISAPLSYGNTPVRVRMIGPAGQERVEELMYVVPSLQIPSGGTRYSLGGGACDGFGCEAYGFAEVGRGLSRTLTAYAGADWLRVDGRGDQARPYARLGFGPTPSTHLGLQARGSSYLRADVQHYRGRTGSFRASYAWTGGDGSVLGPPGWVGTASSSFQAGVLGPRWLHARLFLRGLASDRVDSWQAALSTNVHLTNFEVGAESLLGGSTIATARVQQTIVQRLPGPLRSLSVGSGVGFSSRGIDLFEAGATAQTTRQAAIDARFRSRRGLDPTLTLGVTVPAPFGFFRGRGTTGRQSSYYIGADGGFVFDPATGPVPLLYQGLGQAGVSGDVYYDLDGDGERDPDEPPAPGVTVVIDGRRAATDDEGRFVRWELVPYEGVTITIDPRSLEPEWATDGRELLLRPTPNVLTPVSIPLHRAGQVMGSVVERTPDGPRALAGAGIEIVNAGTGAVVITERTFSDGVFYVAQLRTGRYVLRLSTATAGALGLTGAPELPFDVPSDVRSVVELPPLELGSALPGRIP